MNAASRMASHGMPGEIQVDPHHDTNCCEKGFVMEERGPVDIKGIGLHDYVSIKGCASSVKAFSSCSSLWTNSSCFFQ